MERITHNILRYLKSTDIFMILFTLLASVFGLILISSATHGQGRTTVMQIVGIAIGFVAMILISTIDYHDIAKLWKPIAIICVILFMLTLVLGKSRAGSQDKSWIWLGPITIQPGEFVKVGFIITFAKHCNMVKDNINSPRNIMLLTLHALVPICFLILQRDMGMMLVFLIMFVIMMYFANVRLIYFAVAGIVTLVGFPAIWNKILGATQKNRILALFDPIKYATELYQQTQGRKAIGSGEMFGFGLFHGPITQGAAGLLPEKQNDMIFAVAGEELGFIGCILILLILIVLLMKIVIDSRKSKDALGEMICLGVFASFTVQALINIGAVLMIFPITGISLPFFSSGASSIVSCFMAIGIVNSVYMHRLDSIFIGKDN